MSRNYVNHYLSSQSIVIVFDHDMPLSLTAEHPLYNKLRSLISEDRCDEIPAMACEADRIKLHSKGLFYLKDSVVMFKDSDESLPNALSDRLLQFTDASLPVQPLINFWNNLKDNESEDSKRDLFDFLEVNNVPITEDGCFIAYKRVRDDWYDHYTGKTFLNTPGSTIKVDRKEVDPDRNNTCSKGLHVAAFTYASGGHGLFTHGRLLKIKVNPRNVVTVPPDYDQQKMRICEYEVLGEIEREYLESPLYTENPDNYQYDDDYDDNYQYDDSYDDYEYDDEDFDDVDYEDQYGIDVEDSDNSAVIVGQKMTLTPNKDKRYLIPKALTSGIGLGEGEIIGVFDVNGRCVIAPSVDQAVKTIKTYQIDNHGNIRIANSHLKHFGLDDRASLSAWIENVDSELQIVLGG
jgi:hypothetical protein